MTNPSRDAPTFGCAGRLVGRQPEQSVQEATVADVRFWTLDQPLSDICVVRRQAADQEGTFEDIDVAPGGRRSNAEGDGDLAVVHDASVQVRHQREKPAQSERRQIQPQRRKVAFLFTDRTLAYPSALLADRLGGDPAAAARVLDGALAALEALPPAGWNLDAIEAAIRGLEEPLGMKLRKFVSVLYVAAMGAPQGIPLFDSLALLGRDRALARLRDARARL